MLLSLTSPSKVLEIGTAHGYSSVFFAKKLPDAHITTIERNPVMIEAAKAEFASRKEGERIEFLNGDALEILDGLVKELSEAPEYDKYDFVFIDAAKSHYKRFLDAALKLSHPGTVIVADNVLFQAKTVSDEYDPSGKHKTNIRRLREFIEYVYDHPALETSLASCGDGLTISVVKEI
jgi:predicted O-methyltransferase YrrM